MDANVQMGIIIMELILYVGNVIILNALHAKIMLIAAKLIAKLDVLCAIFLLNVQVPNVNLDTSGMKPNQDLVNVNYVSSLANNVQVLLLIVLFARMIGLQNGIVIYIYIHNYDIYIFYSIIQVPVLGESMLDLQLATVIALINVGDAVMLQQNAINAPMRLEIQTMIVNANLDFMN